MPESKPCHPLMLDEPLTPLHPSEERLLRYIRALGHGSMEVKIADGRPVLIEQVVKKIKLA